MELELNPNNYAGIPDEYAHLETAKVVLLPVPYDGTSTWGKGADKGPKAFLEASLNMELYDIETQSEVFRQGIYLSEPVKVETSAEAMCEAVQQVVANYLEQEKFVTVFGGEHSVSIGNIRAHRAAFDNLTVIQLDAHADLRPEYEGSACNHACALHESSRKDNLIQVGIRSMDKLEEEFMDRDKVYFAHEINGSDNWINKAVNQCTENVFVTIDLDCFDAGIMPSTGTPEPGGLDFYTVLKFCKKLFQEKNVVGFDIVELAPNKNNPAPDFLAAKLYYKLLSYKFEL